MRNEPGSVNTKSWASTSAMAERVLRMMMPSGTIDMVTIGRMAYLN